MSIYDILTVLTSLYVILRLPRFFITIINLADWSTDGMSNSEVIDRESSAEWNLYDDLCRFIGSTFIVIWLFTVVFLIQYICDMFK